MKNTSYSETGEALLTAEKSDSIKIDHLAFTIPMTALRFCRSAGDSLISAKIKTGEKLNPLTKEKYSTYKNVKLTSIYPELPRPQSFTTGELEDFEKYKIQVNKQLAGFYEKTLKIWVETVLGLTLSPMRGRGLHGYKDSMTLRANGLDVGFVGIGGQRDTIYFQISGTGCKTLFSHTTPFVLHHWLAKVFCISKVSRIDLCYDDFDSNFDCHYAEKAYKDGWFRSSERGQSPSINPSHKYTYDSNMNQVFTQEMITIGSRSSLIYWRIYNKKLEQGIIQPDLNWYRSEAELKKWDVDCLLNVAATFAGLCNFAASIDLEKGVRTREMSKAKEACLDIASRVRHVRRSAGKALGDILEILQGDIEATFGMILPQETGGKLGFPPTYQKLINTVIEV